MNSIVGNTITVILGGGQGTRLLPLTKVRSKPAVPFGGKYRLVDIPISNSLNNGLHRIFVLTQFNSFSLNRHLLRAYRFDPFGRGFVELIAAEQTVDSASWFQGTADAVRQVLPHLEAQRPERVLILSGDQLYQMDLTKMLAEHEADGRELTIACLPIAPAEAGAFGILRSDPAGTIRDFVEKPADEALVRSLTLADGRCIASMGIYLFDFPVLKSLLAEDTRQTDFGRHIIPTAISRHRVKAFHYEGYWEDIGTIASFFEANLRMARSDAPIDLYCSDQRLYTRARFLPPAKLLGARVEDSLLAEGSILQASLIRDCVIGVRSIVGPDAVLERVVMMGGDTYEVVEAGNRDLRWHVGPRSRIRNAILDKNCRVGSDCRLLNERGLREYTDAYLQIRDGIIVVPKGASIPDGYVI